MGCLVKVRGDGSHFVNLHFKPYNTICHGYVNMYYITLCVIPKFTHCIYANTHTCTNTSMMHAIVLLIFIFYYLFYHDYIFEYLGKDGLHTNAISTFSNLCAQRPYICSFEDQTGKANILPYIF